MKKLSMELRIKENLKIIEEHSNVALKAKLVCKCGCEKFKLYHTGKQTKGILASHLRKKNKQIEIVAQCEQCGKRISILDTTIDGEDPITVNKGDLFLFKLKGQETFCIELAYNFDEKNYMTNKFVDCFVFGKNDKEKKYVIYE